MSSLQLKPDAQWCGKLESIITIKEVFSCSKQVQTTVTTEKELEKISVSLKNLERKLNKVKDTLDSFIYLK